MLEGSRPRECSYCWNIEDASVNNISDRYIKSNDSWSLPYIDEISQLSWTSDYKPKYLEVMFSNTCNLSCSYCMAHVSSSIDEEMRKYGPYPVKDRVTKRHRQYGAKRPSKDKDLYINAFWRWLPTIYKELRYLRLTGGEPLLDSNLDKLLDYMLENPHDDLVFSCNSNLCFTGKRLDLFFSKIALLTKRTNINVELYTSLDAYGEHAEYIRAGLNYSLVKENILKYIKLFPKQKIVIMCCYNILSIDSFSRFIEDVSLLKKEGQVILDISYLKDPAYLNAKICSKDQLLKIKESIELMKKLNFLSFEIDKLMRIYLLLKSLKEQQNKFSSETRDFKLFVKEYDRRKNKDFSLVFKKNLEDFLV
jgi:organic radical activating enzyme